MEQIPKNKGANQLDFLANPLIFLVPPAGIEPALTRIRNPVLYPLSYEGHFGCGGRLCRPVPDKILYFFSGWSKSSGMGEAP